MFIRQHPDIKTPACIKRGDGNITRKESSALKELMGGNSDEMRQEGKTSGKDMVIAE
jgi:hypothetical protein